MRVLPNIVYIALGLILFAGGMSTANADRPKSEKSSTWSTSDSKSSKGTKGTAGTTITTTPNCITPTQDAAGEGRRAFMRMNCYSCHGMGAHGGSMGPSLVGEADETSEAVLNGEGEGMPSYKNNLCPNDIANLTAYLQLLGTGTEPTFVRWWEPNPTR